jgi:hypothetical protein
MKGATAVPLVRTTRPPNNPNTMTTGSSQNFLLLRMYSQNSDKNSIPFPTTLASNWTEPDMSPQRFPTVSSYALALAYVAVIPRLRVRLTN